MFKSVMKNNSEGSSAFAEYLYQNIYLNILT